MAMKKMIVYESLRDFKEANMSLNEAIFSNAIGAIKKFFKKVGKFFVGLFTKGAIAPVNIGIMVKEKNLPAGISYVPSKQDLSMEPGLSSLNQKVLFDKRGGEDSGDKTTNESVNEALLEAKVPLEHPNKNIRNVDKHQLYKKIEMAIDNPKSRPVMIWGAPGIGKTAIVKAVLESNGDGRLIDVQTAKMAPDDWALPVIVREQMFIEGKDYEKASEKEKKDATQAAADKLAAKTLTNPDTYKMGQVRAVDVPKSWLPVFIPTGDKEEDKRRDDVANLGDGGVLFLDELSRAKSSVQNTCLKLIGERIIGDAKIGSKWTIISASNRMIDDPAGEQNFSTALGNRFQQINYVPDFKGWKEWAMNKVDPRILDFIEFNQEYFYTLDTDSASDESDIFASPRSWEGASEAIENLMAHANKKGYKVTSKMIVDEVTDSVGGAVAQEFGAFLHLLETFKKEDIREILVNPEKARLPKKAGSGYDQSEANAILSLVCTATRGKELPPKEFDNFVTYLIRLDHPSLATRAVKMMIDIHPDIHEELGEVEGRDKYKKGIEAFIEKYKDIF